MSYLFAFSYCSWGSQGKNTEVVCHSLLQWTTFCQTSPPWPEHLGWPCTAWLSFTELDKAVVLGSDWLLFCDYGFCVPAPWCPLKTPTILLGFLLPWTWGISSWLLQQSAAAAPYLGRGVSPLGPPELHTGTHTCPTQLHTYKWESVTFAATLDSVTSPEPLTMFKIQPWHNSTGIGFAQKAYSMQQIHPPSSHKMDDLATWVRRLRRLGHVCEHCSGCRPGWESGFNVTALCLSVAAGERLVGILLLYLPGVPGPESGVPSDAGGDHQWPAAKGGVRECQDPLFSQEVTGDVSQEELCLKFPRVVPHPRRTREKSYFWHTWWFIPTCSAVFQVENHVKGWEVGRQGDVALARPAQSGRFFLLQPPALRNMFLFLWMKSHI